MMTAREINALSLHQRNDRQLRQMERDMSEPVDQWQEHCDHVAGEASEQQNAFALSQIEHRSGMQGVNDLIRAGLFVVVIEGPAYCRFTDAVIGTRYMPIAACRTREEADAICEAEYIRWEGSGGSDECSCDVYPKLAPPPNLSSVDLFDDDIPF